MSQVLKTNCAVCGYLDNEGKNSFTFKAADIAHSAESGCTPYQILRDSLAHASPEFVHEVGEVKVEKGKDRPLVLTYLVKGSLAQESIEIYSHASAPTAYSWVGPGEEISIDGSSNACFELIQSWIQDCVTNHPQCPVDQSPKLPTRVIDVGSVSQPPRLHISQLERAEYIALSHCWGPPEKAAVTVKTTASTLQQFQSEIPWGSLTKTFRDAILITRRLGIQYLWIDSLCIIQGDAQDWAIEASKMTIVYSNAFVIICASGASDGDQGFIRNRSASAEGVLRMECQSLKDTTSFVYARRSRRGIHFTLAEMRGGEYSHGWKSAMGQPLETRAWTFQEEELATRLLFYTEDEVQWRCRKVNACECRVIRELKGKGYLPGHTTGGLLPDGAKQLPHQSVVDWYFIVAKYTRRDMTYMSDRLPGLSGIAGHWEKAENDTYHAGLWRKDLPHQLLWFAHAVGLGAPARGSLRHPAYYAPTWSWASITGGIQHIREPGEIHVRVIDVQTDPATINRFGPVKRGNLVLSAVLIPVTLVREQSTPFSPGGMIKAVDARLDREQSDIGAILPDVQTAAGDSEIDVHEPHYLLPVCCKTPPRVNARTKYPIACLLLRHSKSVPNAFEREGFLFSTFVSGWEGLTSGLLESEITII
ncbi:HET-domain-containing protein [Xylaria digitata]|nr:HET-domain-containing protein [Xylaria digitata]